MWAREIFVVKIIGEIIEHLYVYGDYTIIRDKLMMQERKRIITGVMSLSR